MHRAARSITVLALVAAVAAIPLVTQAGASANTPLAVQPASCNHEALAGSKSCFLFIRTNSAAHPDTGPQLGAYSPSNLQAAYGLTSAASSDGTGERVYISVAFNDPNIDTDLAAYRTQYGLPACTEASGCLQVLNQSGAASPLPPNSSAADEWSGETSLQADMISAICPNCEITVMEANDDTGDGLYIETQEAATLGAKFVSLPWGTPDSASSTASDAQDDAYFSPTGVVYAVAAGDDGYGTGSDPGGPTYPAASPDAVAVGGTTLTDSGGTFTQTAWSSGQSGCATHEPQPSWQAATIPSTVCADRAVNDVAAIGDPDNGVSTYDTDNKNGGWQTVGGTSVSAPVIAATFALAGTPAPNEVPASLMYTNAASLRDIKTGHDGTCPNDTLLCTAATGWDGPTGNGTPNGIAAFAPPANDPTALTVGKAITLKYGASTTLATTLSVASTHTVVASASVQLQAKTAGASSFTTVKTLSTSPSGTASAKVTPKLNTTYRWSYAGKNLLDPTTSKPQTVDVAAAVALAAKPTKPKHGKKFALFGTVTGGKAGLKVTVEVKSGAKWKAVGTAKLAKLKLPNGKTETGYVVKTHLKTKGDYLFRTVSAKSSANAAGTSKTLTVKVT
jgi:hypothetical protein